MATYDFSALSDGQSVSFAPGVDVLRFDQSLISAADIRITASGTGTRVEVVSGQFAGKDVLLLNTAPLQLYSGNVTFANGSRLLAGDNSASQNDNAANALAGTVGSDVFYGFGGNDTMSGGDGADVFVIASASAPSYGDDSVNGGGGRDIVDFSGAQSAVTGSVARLTGGGLNGAGSVSMGGVDGIIGGAFNDNLRGNGGSNQLFDGGGGSDTLDGGFGTGDTLIGGTGDDTYIVHGTEILIEAGGIDTVVSDGSWTLADGFENLTLAGSGSTSAFGNSAANVITGNAAGNIIEGGPGNDRLTGGAGPDLFSFKLPGAAHADRITDFASGSDKLMLDAGFMSALGAGGNFTAGDPRFHAAAGATSGQDADDRIVYDTSTGNVFYDADGSGPGAAQLIATLDAPARTLVATDITVIGAPPPPPPSGQGTPGNDTLTGTAGSDTLDGLGGNDLISGLGAADSLIGGAGNDTLDGGAGVDTLDGGVGDDTYFTEGAFGSFDDVLRDSAGADTLILNLRGGEVFLPQDFENLTVRGSARPVFGDVAAGNASNNVIRNELQADGLFLDGGGGDDTLIGGGFSDLFSFSGSAAGYGNDVVDGGGGIDTIFVGDASAAVVDGRLGIVTGGGAGGSGSVSFSNIEVVQGGFGNDRLIASDAGMILLGNSGNDTLEGGAGNDDLRDDQDIAATEPVNTRTGDDLLSGGAGNDRLIVSRGNDTAQGGAGNDVILIQAQSDTRSYGTDFIDGGDGIDTVEILAYSDVTVDLAAGTLTGGDDFGLDGRATLTAIENFTMGVQGGRVLNADIRGSSGANLLIGSAGIDSLNGRAGNDTLQGGGGADSFIFDQAPGAANADVVLFFSTASDTLELDATVMSALGASGRFTPGDGRFHAAAGATTGVDADDRVIYNTTTGELFYDADGSGPGAAQLIATLQGAPTLVASDITVIGQGAPVSTQPTEGDDSLTGTQGNDTIDGRGGNDTLRGLGGADVLIGGLGNDVFEGGAGNDTMSGGDGADRFVMMPAGVSSYGSDSINGGSGRDVVDFSGAQSAVTGSLVGLTGGGANGAGSVAMSAVDGIIGGAFNDNLRGNGGSNQLLDGGGGNDTLDGGFGTGDTLIGGVGADTFIVRGGEALVDGGSDFGFSPDLLDYSLASAQTPLVVDLAAGTASGGGAIGAPATALVSIERVTGSMGNDRLMGNDGDFAEDTLRGGPGNDTIDGRGGSDRIEGGPGNDSLIGGDSFDIPWLDQPLPAEMIDGGAGNDTMSGGGGSDGFILAGDYGVDVIDGGAGLDLIFGGGSSGLVLDLAAGTVSGSGTGQASLVNVEGAMGTEFGDRMLGNAADNLLWAHGGNDSLSGAGGNDSLLGEAGNDTLTGGAGADEFFLSTRAADADLLTDFSTGTDTLVLSGFLEGVGDFGDFAAQDPRFHAAPGASTAQDASDRVIYNSTTGQLFYDPDGTGAAPASLIATLQGAPQVAATDFTVF